MEVESSEADRQHVHLLCSCSMIIIGMRETIAVGRFAVLSVIGEHLVVLETL